MATYNMRNYAPRDTVPPPNWSGERTATPGVGTGGPRTSKQKAKFEPDPQLRTALETFIGKLSTSSLRDRNWAITSLRRSIAEFGQANMPKAKTKEGKKEPVSTKDRKPGINKIAKRYPEYRELNDAYDAVKAFHTEGKQGPQEAEERYSKARIAFEELKKRLKTKMATDQLNEEEILIEEEDATANAKSKGKKRGGRKSKTFVPLGVTTRSMETNKVSNPAPAAESFNSESSRKREPEAES